MKISWYKKVREILRSIQKKACHALELYSSGDHESVKAVKEYIQGDYDELEKLWKVEIVTHDLSDLGRHIHFSEKNDYENIVKCDVPKIDKMAEEHALGQEREFGFENLLHPIIKRSSLQHYKDGHFRDAVLNSIIAVYEFIRSKSSSDEDGDKLIGKVFSLEAPKLILSEITSESGKNDQKGFMQIFKGAYQGIRNPKAHSLSHDLTDIKAAQYLVFASLLARRIDEAIIEDGL